MALKTLYLRILQFFKKRDAATKCYSKSTKLLGLYRKGMTSFKNKKCSISFKITWAEFNLQTSTL